ncbi:MAG: sigma-70 family RNA polymerase sigma factor [Spirochaetales bacterium]|nr:sigma-70 family RNA polymerase sigma factor [Spirochaetales bacterium]
MKKLPDNELVKRIIAGEYEAYREIVARHQTRIFYMGLKFFHNRHDAEDYAQEVFLKTFVKLRSFKAEVPFASWLNKIAYNMAVNQYHKRRRARVEVAMQGEPRDDSLSPETRILRNELCEKVHRVLKKIPDVYKPVINLHFFEGLSYPEISRALSIPVNTIKSYVFRAKQLLRTRLGSYVDGYLEEGVI